jgi:hypothetical protein
LETGVAYGVGPSISKFTTRLYVAVVVNLAVLVLNTPPKPEGVCATTPLVVIILPIMPSGAGKKRAVLLLAAGNGPCVYVVSTPVARCFAHGQKGTKLNRQVMT